MQERHCEIHNTPLGCYIKPNRECCLLTPGLLAYWATALYDDPHCITGKTYFLPPPHKLFDNVSPKSRPLNPSPVGQVNHTGQAIHASHSFAQPGQHMPSPCVPTIIHNIGQPLTAPVLPPTTSNSADLTTAIGQTLPSANPNQFYQPNPQLLFPCT